MVQISIQALKNLNNGGRSYPHSGYLGLTKLLVEGVVRTRVEEDRKLMAATSITISVKCYEARTKLTYSKINTLVDATTVLWTSPAQECTDIGDMDLPFRITVPPSVSGYSNLSFPEYKVFWRLEAVINHPPHFGLGVRQLRFYDLNLTRYDVQDPPPSPFLSRPSPIPGYQLCSASPRITPFYYRIDDPDHAVGPGDELPVSLNVIFDDSTSPKQQIQSMSVLLERRLDLFEASGSPTPPEILSGNGNISPYSNNTSEASSTVSLASMITSRSSTLSRKRSASPPSNLVLSSKTITGTIATAHSSEFHSNAPHQYSGVVRLALPAKPPPSQWPVGESLKTDLAHIRFELRVKITVSSPSGPVDVALEPMEIRLAPLSQEQRSVAFEKIARKKKAYSSKSAPSSRRTSPSPSTSGSSKAGPDTPPPIPTPGPSPFDFEGRFPLSAPAATTTTTVTGGLGGVDDSDHMMSASASGSGWKHRSAGKRRAQSAALSLTIPSTRQRSGSSALKSSGAASASASSASTSSASTITIIPTKSHGVTTATTNLKRMPSQAVRAWEEELEQISTRSKRRSDEMISGGAGSTSDVEKSTRSIRGTRTRRGTVNTMSPPPSAYIFAAQRNPPIPSISGTS
ncbi:hypothetical protein M408DRAFT_274309 [Serendipita vermifera MAFF 305830]|uniref:Uncharacterized protein n=1 Tax=Serendipita vermifera MAFF 305830 TaxID=933852 RepID=A0A0C3BHR3_SERVB|nr:hypothetical protein M408DRAFT_274309 [Serendipita vermifera MAFF 305830]